jgi:hypothetical protein
MAIAPDSISTSGSVQVPHASNLNVVISLSQNKVVHIAQVHSHPSEWVDHSSTDDSEAAFKVNGLLSLVVPNYGFDGMGDLLKCGIHRFEKETFIRMRNKYVGRHFRIIKSNSSILIDQRNGK